MFFKQAPLSKIIKFILRFILLFLLVMICQRSELPISEPSEQVRYFTRMIEFDYISWSLEALWLKWNQWALGTNTWIFQTQKPQWVKAELKLTQQIIEKESELNRLFSDPQHSHKVMEIELTSRELNLLKQKNQQLAPLAESILQEQLNEIIAQKGLSLLGQSLPPPLFRTSPMPLALVISPREVIRQDLQISLVPNLSIEQIIELEDAVARSQNVSALVVEIGGVGTYPTMVMRTTDLNWLAEVIAHEWTHNYLTLHPLGINYDTSPALRTMNETTANIVGKEVGSALIAKYYPELMPKPAPPSVPKQSYEKPNPPSFNFNKEMHKTRVEVDRLLSLGKVAEAEEYMEKRRQIFWENGYAIRKLNQAYFAFHGAYADEEQSAAGADPVGEAVRTLRAQHPSLAEFVHLMAWMWNENQLFQAIRQK